MDRARHPHRPETAAGLAALVRNRARAAHRRHHLHVLPLGRQLPGQTARRRRLQPRQPTVTRDPATARFDELIHFPTRLRIIAAIATTAEIEFSALEDALGISTSLLSKQLRILAEVGYLDLDKRPQSFGRPRTWIHLTPVGRRAYLGHLEALRQLTSSSQ
ncbi:MAG: transcriptional regulator [Propionibacteriaceae bacterium]|nr:transcriptional regulator [Propionibacteriaceae bacterium]